MNRYQVQPGDTLGKIARTFYGDSSQYVRIMEANNITNANLIQVGQELVIPALEQAQAFVDQVPRTEDGDIQLSAEQLQAIMPNASAENIAKYLPALNAQLDKFNINTPLRLAHFLAQIAHESGSFNYKSENLNYSAKALTAVFGKYFDNQSAQDYERKPELIANRVYANRLGNGDETCGDGWAYRGRGLIQLTGRDNYRKASQGIGIELEQDPDCVAENPEIAVQVSAWYWRERNLNDYADQDDAEQITRRINGGLNGFQDRLDFLNRAKEILLND